MDVNFFGGQPLDAIGKRESAIRGGKGAEGGPHAGVGFGSGGQPLVVVGFGKIDHDAFAAGNI